MTSKFKTRLKNYIGSKTFPSDALMINDQWYVRVYSLPAVSYRIKLTEHKYHWQEIEQGYFGQWVERTAWLSTDRCYYKELGND